MKILLFLVLFIVACSCMPIKDAYQSPAQLNQDRLMFQDESDNVIVGLYSTTNINELLKIRTFGEGDIEIHGDGPCALTSKLAFKNQSTFDLNISDFAISNMCLYQIHQHFSGLDNSVNGSLLISLFDNNNGPLPLKTIIAGREKEGTNTMQIRETKELQTTVKIPIISESRIISVISREQSGSMIVKGCGITKPYPMNSNNQIIVVDDVIDKKQNPCALEIGVNHTNQRKEFATVLINIYKDHGSFLATPFVKNSNKWTCFKFTDSYVVKKIINGKQYSGTTETCFYNENKFEVISYTSSLRTFYGIYENNKWRNVQ